MIELDPKPPEWLIVDMSNTIHFKQLCEKYGHSRSLRYFVGTIIGPTKGGELLIALYSPRSEMLMTAEIDPTHWRWVEAIVQSTHGRFMMTARGVHSVRLEMGPPLGAYGALTECANLIKRLEKGEGLRVIRSWVDLTSKTG